jgi:hypothetical protein
VESEPLSISDRRREQATLFLLGALVAFSVICRLISAFVRTFNHDEFQVWYTAWMQSTGAVPGKDFYLPSYHLLVAFLEPPYKVKVPAMGQFTPPSSLVAEEVAAEFMRWQDRLIDISFQAHGLHLARLTAKIPYLSRGLPALSLGQWLRYIAAHARRHLWQMEHLVLNAANFPR